MTFTDFIHSLEQETPPADISSLLKALWYDKKGNWDKAHQIVQGIHSNSGSWIHAYLHRVEGDQWNANYWYSKAHKNMPKLSLEDEWEYLVKHFL